MSPRKSPVRNSKSFKEINSETKSKSPRKGLGYTSEIKSLPTDTIDPIYLNTDPISVSTKARIQEGSVAS